jgi:ATP-binding cassette subfamily F protein uup
MSVISISNAQLAFGHVALLDHTEFSLEAGERIGLIGRNGTGKSSLMFNMIFSLDFIKFSCRMN